MEKLKVAIGSDHGGYELKERIIKYFIEKGIEYKDFGTYTKESIDYPIIAKEVCQNIISNDFNRGILVCGTGLGMSIAANKNKGIRAVALENTYSARLSRQHNNANVLCLGERVLGDNLAIDIVEMWLNTDFEGGRHQRRIDMFE